MSQALSGSDLGAALKSYRTRRSGELSQPPYCVFTNAELDVLVATCPRSPTATLTLILTPTLTLPPTLTLTLALTLTLTLTRSLLARAPRPSSAGSRASVRRRCPSSETISCQSAAQASAAPRPTRWRCPCRRGPLPHRRSQVATLALPSKATARNAPTSSRSLHIVSSPTLSSTFWSPPARAPRPSSAGSRASVRRRCPSSETISCRSAARASAAPRPTRWRRRRQRRRRPPRPPPSAGCPRASKPPPPPRRPRQPPRSPHHRRHRGSHAARSTPSSSERRSACSVGRTSSSRAPQAWARATCCAT